MRKLYFLFLLLSPLISFGQERVTTVGLQFKPMLPVSYLNAEEGIISNGDVNFELDNKFGFAGGMVVRHGFSDRLAFETGINYVKRSYDLLVDDENLRNLDTSSFSIIGYEIPALGLVYIRLSREIYMNAAFGFSFDFYPTDVGTRTDFTETLTLRRSWIRPSLLANIGWEYRTRESGIFYLGGSFHRPFGPTYVSRVIYDDGNALTRELIELSGIYLTVDFRYFFHEKPTPKQPKARKRN